MFFYFGRKARTAKSYPAPEYPLVIEPFAGSMAYSLKWRPRQAIGIERDAVIHDLWHRLVGMTEQEIRDFPAPVLGERTYDRWVIQCSASSANAECNYRKVNGFIIGHFEHQRAAALANIDYVKRSVLYSGSDQIDFEELAAWCMSRRGQVIVCEGPAGSWLPFQHHLTMQGPASQQQRNGKPNVEHVLTRRTHARCGVCSVTFPAARADARYCSARCRQRARRQADTPVSAPARRALVRGPRQRP